MPVPASRPNIIILYADDLGFGDVGCYGATEIPTPNVDRLAAAGIRFTNGYATAATCTPSRYSLLTGSYPWRNDRAAILPGDAPLIVEPGSPTLPGMLQRAGYRTGVVGKWHLGLGRERIDWNDRIQFCPNDVGFDYSFIMPATNDRVPCVYLENGRVVNLDPNDPIEVTYDDTTVFPGELTGRDHPELLRVSHSHGHDGTIVNGVGRIGHMKGGTRALWTDETMAETFAKKAVEFIAADRDQPFFLYYALHQPHVPRLPNPRFRGATKLGARGDVVVEMDWCVGEVLNALDRLGIRENTIVIFSSDNGPVLDDGYRDGAEELKDGHRPAGPLRGGKYSLFDGGTRVPFILSWPKTVKRGESDALVSHVDFHASFAALNGQKLNDEEAPDSLNLLDALLGRSGTGREELVVEGTRSKTVYRCGDWVFIPPYQGPRINGNTNTELGNSPDPQLYDLSRDIGQITNLAARHPERAKELAARLDEIRAGNQTRQR
ncbi:MAG TPA: arylsulfatase [Candidatus Latescibacteria bacterium]|nr:arylsulfatase [Candidatus Latescibacterota bacterium]